jgi:hypothetical protein
MGKIYTIVLNSAQGTLQPYTDIGTNTTTTDIRSVGYFYDWSLLPEKRYKLNFTFITSGHTSTWTNVLNIFSDFAQLNTRFATPQYTAGNSSLNYSFLGLSRTTLIGVNSYLFADENLNGSLYLNGRPTNNNFVVYLLNNDANKSPYSSTLLFGNYTLSLSFEELDD